VTAVLPKNNQISHVSAIQSTASKIYVNKICHIHQPASKRSKLAEKRQLPLTKEILQ